MLPFVTISVLLAAGVVCGQSTVSETAEASGTVRDSPTSTTTDTGTTHTIAVGSSGHKFTPGETRAEVGDTLEFRFYPVDHWVIQGDFDNPCIPYDYVEPDRRGFSSGEQRVQSPSGDGPRFRVRVNDTKPIYFYCGAPGSCVRYHMMGVVNPSRNATLEDWQKRAKDVDFQLRPGDPWPSEVDRPTGMPTSVPEPSGSDGSGDQDGESTSHGLGGGAIAGIAVGAVVGVLLLVLVAFLCLRRRGFSIVRPNNRQSTVISQVPGMGPSGPTHPSMVFEGSAQQKLPIQYAQQHSAQAIPPYGSPTTPPFSAVSYGSYYPPPPSLSPQPPNGNGTVPPDGTTAYHEHLQAYLKHQQPPQRKTDSPVELPTTQEEDESKLPRYKDPRFSWAGAEAEYRPSPEPRHD